MEIEFQKKWDEVTKRVNARFGQDLDVQSILFVIGLQELGLNADKFTKDQKVEVMHVAVCALLEPHGFYKFEGRDKDGWPHWTTEAELPRLSNGEQETLLKEAIMEYLENSI